MKKNKVEIDKKTSDQVHVIEEHLRKIMSFVDCDTALLAASVALGKYIEEHSKDAYDIIEWCSRVHSGALISAGILNVDSVKY